MSSEERLYHPYQPAALATPKLSNAPERYNKVSAVRIIEHAWCRYRDRTMFQLLKTAIRAAEVSLPHKLLRRISPMEAQLLHDRGVQVKIRFRFEGHEFPPVIVFKIFASCRGGVRFLSGQKMIAPASDAARDACRLMGSRTFMEQIVLDQAYQESRGVVGEQDVVTLKDYMQYCSFVDELPAQFGGKNNPWRRLTLHDISRQTLFYDVLDFVNQRRMSPALRKKLTLLTARPSTPRSQKEQIDLLLRLRRIKPALPNLPNSMRSVPATGRRTKKAQQKVEQMKRNYTFVTAEEDEDDWEEEAESLYQWTQELSLDNIDQFGSERNRTGHGKPSTGEPIDE